MASPKDPQEVTAVAHDEAMVASAAPESTSATEESNSGAEAASTLATEPVAMAASATATATAATEVTVAVEAKATAATEATEATEATTAEIAPVADKAPRKRKTSKRVKAVDADSSAAQVAEGTTAQAAAAGSEDSVAAGNSGAAAEASTAGADGAEAAVIEAAAGADATEASEGTGKAKAKTQKAAKAPKTTKAKASKKQSDPLDVAFMAEHAQKALDLSAPVLLCPVRHHSFALSLHLPRLIAAYQPDCIAVEMPWVFKEEVTSLANSEVVPPVAFFSFATPKKTATKTKAKAKGRGAGAVNVEPEEPEEAAESADSAESVEAAEGAEGAEGANAAVPSATTTISATATTGTTSSSGSNNTATSTEDEDESDSYRSYLYPLLPFSPEYVALTEAMKQGIDYELIDLTSFARESFTSFSEESTYYDDDQVMMRSRFFDELLERSGDHSFPEFWDKNFEINALTQDTMSYLRQLYSYCYILRYGLNEEIETFTVQRELFMLKNVQAAMKTHKRVLVITGGLHSVALCDYLYYKKKKVTAQHFAKVPSETYLIPYSFVGADSQQGYGAGIVFPYYYQQFYQVLKEFVPFSPWELAKLNKEAAVSAVSAVPTGAANTVATVATNALAAVAVAKTASEVSAASVDNDSAADKDAAAISTDTTTGSAANANATATAATMAGTTATAATASSESNSAGESAAAEADAPAEASGVKAMAAEESALERTDVEFFAGIDRSNLAFKVLSALLNSGSTAGSAARKAAQEDDPSKLSSRAKRGKGKKNKAPVYYDALGKEINVSTLTGTGVEQAERSQLILTLAQQEQQDLASKSKKTAADKADKADKTEKVDKADKAEKAEAENQAAVASVATSTAGAAATASTVGATGAIEAAAATAGAEAPTVEATSGAVATPVATPVTPVELTLEQKEALLHFQVPAAAIVDVNYALNLFFVGQLRDYRKQKFSTADKISCEQSLRGLAALRQKQVPSVFELIDAVKSTLIKEELTDRYYLLDQLMLLLTSVRMGQVPLDVRMPPLWRDFLKQCKTYGISLKDQQPHQLRVDINKDAKSLAKSRLINRIAFLSPAFLPEDLNAEGNHTFNYISRTETYVYQYSDEVVMQIMGASVHGESLLKACRTVLCEHCKAPNLNLAQICGLYRQCVNMGIEDQYYHVKELLAQAILRERSLICVGQALSELNSYDFVAKSTPENKEILLSLIYDLVKRGCEILLQQNDVAESEIDEFVHALEELNYYAIKYDNSRQLYFSVLEEMLQTSDLGATLQGAYLALLYKNRRLSYEVLVDYVNQFVLGSINNSKDSGGFFYTLILISRGNLFNRDSILSLLNTYLDSLDGDEFLKVLVLLRRVFMHFNSVELHKLVRMLKRLLGLDTLDFTYQVEPQEFMRNRQIDHELEQDMRKWHLLANSPRPAVVPLPDVPEAKVSAISDSSAVSATAAVLPVAAAGEAVAPAAASVAVSTRHTEGL